MVKTQISKTLYKVPENDFCSSDSNGLFSSIYGIRCTDNMNVRYMSMEDAFKHSVPIEGHIIDESIKDCLIFTFYDAINYGLEKDEFVEIKYEELIVECEPIEIITCE